MKICIHQWNTSENNKKQVKEETWKSLNEEIQKINSGNHIQTANCTEIIKCFKKAERT